MKVVTAYLCEACDTLFHGEDEALLCEAYHHARAHEFTVEAMISAIWKLTPRAREAVFGGYHDLGRRFVEMSTEDRALVREDVRRALILGEYRPPARWS